MHKIQNLQSKIFTYKKRLKSNFEAHKKRQKAIRTKVKNWENQLKEQIKVREELKVIAKSIKFETGVDITKNKRGKGEKTSFYKIALEDDFKGTEIADFANVNPRIPALSRKRITRGLINSTTKKKHDNIKKIIKNE